MSHQGWWSWCLVPTTNRLKHPNSCRGLNLTEPQFPHQHNRDNSSNYITGLFELYMRLPHVKNLGQDLTQIKPSMKITLFNQQSSKLHTSIFHVFFKKLGLKKFKMTHSKSSWDKTKPGKHSQSWDP